LVRRGGALGVDTMEAPNLCSYQSVADWRERNAGPFFPSRASLDWFIKLHRSELVERGALIPGRGRGASLVEPVIFARAVVEIFSKQAREDAGLVQAST